MLAALDAAAADGAGAVGVGDRMLDEALALSARRVLARAGAGAMSVAASRGRRLPPWFEDLQVGTVFADAPALTLTEGHAALHQAIVGDRLRLALDAHARRGGDRRGSPLAHPALVWDVAIGQSTLATAARDRRTSSTAGCVLRRAVRLGDTLRTTHRGRRAARRIASSEGRAATGLAVLRIRTVDQEDRPVLDFTRCAMLPLRDAPTGEPADAGRIAPADLEPAAVAARGGRRAGDLAAYRAAVRGPHFADVARRLGQEIEGGDVVDSRARARAADAQRRDGPPRRDGSTGDGRRLVYGGHTIGLAAAQASRALPTLVTILGWHACDHLAPVFEGDTLRIAARARATRAAARRAAGCCTCARASRARAPASAEDADVLDWRFVAVLA